MRFRSMLHTRVAFRKRKARDWVTVPVTANVEENTGTGDGFMDKAVIGQEDNGVMFSKRREYSSALPEDRSAGAFNSLVRI